MSIDLTQQALNALADAGLGDSPAKAHEAYVIGYTQGHNDALAPEKPAGIGDNRRES